MIKLHPDLAEDVGCEIPARYFRPLAEHAASQLVERGILREKEEIRFLIAAYPIGAKPSAADEYPIAFEDTSALPRLHATRLADFLARSTPQPRPPAQPFSLFVPRQVITEFRAMVQAAGPIETAGILVGHLHQDPDSAEIFVEITAQIPARNAEAQMDKFRFTPATWAAVEATMALRGEPGQILGWVHSHPSRFWCDHAKCSVEKQRTCALQQGFFSADDLTVQRTVFYRAWSVALVFTNWFTGIQCHAFGWEQGMFGPRGFYELDGRAQREPSQPSLPVIGGQICTKLLPQNC
jgi:proteasome lid subunit RPN8/RPN11